MATKLFPQLFTVTETITPEIAKEYLKKNYQNRPISRPKVNKHKRTIEAGKFRHTHQGIAFDWLGNLRDGQHRLSAIAECDKAVTMQVTRGVDPDDVIAIDTEMRQRSVADAIRISGSYSASKQAVAVCNLWMAIQGERNASLHEIDDFLSKHSEAIEFALEVGLQHHNTKHACVLTMLAAGYEAGHGDDLRAWAEVVKRGEISEPWHTSAIRFRDYWMTTKHNGGTTCRVDYCQRIYASMLAWVERRGLARLHAKQFIEWMGQKATTPDA
jgi:hypothetical protein